MGCTNSRDSVYRSSTLYRTNGDIPDIAFKEERIIRCHVVRVIDGDTVRCRHLPEIDEKEEKDNQLNMEFGRLYDETLLLRLCGIDAPERCTKNQEGQPFSEEATEFLKNKCLYSIVWVKLLRKDQYGRPLVSIMLQNTDSSNPLYCFCYSKKEDFLDLGECLLSEGLAVVYYGKGAVYNGRQAEYEDAVSKAREAKKGIWSISSSIRDYPCTFKKREHITQLNPTPHLSQDMLEGARNEIIKEGWHEQEDPSNDNFALYPTVLAEEVIKNKNAKWKKQRKKKKKKRRHK